MSVVHIQTKTLKNAFNIITFFLDFQVSTFSGILLKFFIVLQLIVDQWEEHIF